MTRKILAIIAAAICTLAITATAFAAEFINADQARSIAAQWVPAGSTHLVTKDESHKYAAYYEVKFYDNTTNTEYEVEVLKNGGAVKEFKMDAPESYYLPLMSRTSFAKNSPTQPSLK